MAKVGASIMASYKPKKIKAYKAPAAKLSAFAKPKIKMTKIKSHKIKP
jgi:hypothetical protein